MLEALELEVSRSGTPLFSGVAFTLPPGALLRVSGANGSGKTSLLRTLCGLFSPVSGDVRWRGENIRVLREEYWKHLLYIAHSNALKDDLTAAENLAFACALAGISSPRARVRAALKRFGLGEREHAPTRIQSQGQKRRTALARLALGVTLPLWLLDEPFAALDPEGIKLVQSLLEEHLARGGMVVLTTHQEVPIRAATTLDLSLDR
jgi:heme exporter protein A